MQASFAPNQIVISLMGEVFGVVSGSSISERMGIALVSGRRERV
jgi:hypothetical protein